MTINSINKTSQDKDLKPVFHDDFDMISNRTSFLEAAYNGGTQYKSITDQFGNPILIEHENEVGGNEITTGIKAIFGGNFNNEFATKYGRRRRAAVYENHVKPIIDKIFGYVIRAVPTRFIEEKLIKQLNLDSIIKDLLLESLKLDHYWVGFDAPSVDLEDEKTGEIKEVISKVDEIEIGFGDKYLRLIDPRFIVDWQEDDKGNLQRIVVYEPEIIKSSFTKKEEIIKYYVEWNFDNWIKYKEVDDKKGDGTHLELYSQGTNDFKRKKRNEEIGEFDEETVIPFIKFDPPFPVEDIAEMNRALYNMMSLLDEELFGNTFTQKVITGESADNVAKADSGIGNIMVLPDPESKITTIGAIDGQSIALAERVNQLRDGIYILANLDNSGNKNVAEAADKKKRDMETLYTMLSAVVEGIEHIENWLLWSMGYIDSINDDKASNYPRKFDIANVEEVLTELIELMKIPFVPASLKRRKVKELIHYLSPLEDNKELENEVDNLPDISVVESLERLHLMEQLTPDMLIRLMAIPDDMQAGVKENDFMIKEHKMQEAVDQQVKIQQKLEQTADKENEKFNNKNDNKALPFNKSGVK